MILTVASYTVRKVDVSEGCKRVEKYIASIYPLSKFVQPVIGQNQKLLLIEKSYEVNHWSRTSLPEKKFCLVFCREVGVSRTTVSLNNSCLKVCFVVNKLPSALR